MSKSKKNSKSDINVKILEHEKINDSYNNYLVLQLTGSDINYVIINTIRRVIMELVPTYAFDKANIDITKNTSIYNNDYMRLRLCHFPVIGIENPIETIQQSNILEYDANISTFDKKIEDINIIAEKEQADKLEKAQNFIIYINVKNTSSEVLNVTTAHQDLRYYYKTKPIPSPYIQPLLIIKLKPGEEFIGTLTSSLNIGLKFANYMPNAVCSYAEESEHSFRLNLESLKQLTEQDIIIRACMIIIIKLDNFLNIFTNKIKEYTSSKITDDFNLDNKLEIEQSTSETTTDSAIRNTSDDVLDRINEKGFEKVIGIGVPEIDFHFKPKRGEITLLTGIGNYGKSAFKKWYILTRILLFGEKIIIIL